MAGRYLLYETAEGKSDVAAFLGALPAEARNRCRALLRRLAANELPPGRGFTKKLQGTFIWELRVATRPATRLLYARLLDGDYLILVAVRKADWGAGGRHAIPLAEQRLGDYLARRGHGR